MPNPKPGALVQDINKVAANCPVHCQTGRVVPVEKVFEIVAPEVERQSTALFDRVVQIRRESGPHIPEAA
ncbi:hypothetical protein [Saccharopolyspora pogona]|uniref:hypothetical protein n=1 Tax=Saccharopolyspora pogona TaxID=333966 RepID=UPI00168298FE|nr:hypothetical protein [Saccharopolyspora pogona]